MVVGLDGVPFTLLTQYIKDGTMPNVARICALGNLRKMEVTVPEISSVSWPSFMTGKDPGSHGIFGFTEIIPGSYNLTFPCYSDLKAPPIWDLLEKKGKRSVVINQPGTYPARRLNGALVSGFVAIELHKSVFPAKYIGKLRRLNYEIDIDTNRAKKNHQYALQELDRTLDFRTEAVDMFLEKEEWDFFELVVTGTDRLHHYLWHALVDPEHELHAQTINYYKKVDKLVGKMAEEYIKATKDDSLDGFFMLSDHGFCGIEKEVALTRYLVEKGFIEFETDSPGQLDRISKNSKLLVLDPNRIYVHTKGRFPKGNVDPDDVPKVLEDAKAALSELVYEDKKLVRRFFMRDEAYHGPFVQQAPDMVAVSIDGFDFKGSIDRTETFGNFGLTGMHNQDDAFLWTNKPVDETPFITQVAQLILGHLE